MLHMFSFVEWSMLVGAFVLAFVLLVTCSIVVYVLMLWVPHEIYLYLKPKAQARISLWRWEREIRKYLKGRTTYLLDLKYDPDETRARFIADSEDPNFIPKTTKMRDDL